MGIRGELYTQQVKVENRTYFFNVKENSKGDVFLQGLDKCIEFIEKNRATRQKEIAKKRQTKKTEASKMWKTTNKKDEEKDAKFTKKKVFLKKKQD